MINKREKKWSRVFDFNVSQEKAIYAYVCREKIKRYRKKYLICKFDTYAEWKDYVKGKYISYSSDSLIEFSRYLNYQIRIQPDVNGAFALFMAPIFTVLINFYFEVQTSETSGIVRVVILVPWLFLMGWMVIQVINMSSGDKMKCAFYEDYKEIIDELIREKQVVNDESNSTSDTTYLSSLPNMKKEIIEGLNTSLKDCIPDDEIIHNLN